MTALCLAGFQILQVLPSMIMASQQQCQAVYGAEGALTSSRAYLVRRL